MPDTAIWATALFIPLMTLVLCLAPPLRRAIDAVAAAHGKSAAEREAKAALDLADAEQDRLELEVRRGSLAGEVAREKARLAADTAQLEVDAEAARQCLPDAKAARQAALRARADAEAALAPEAARKALGASDGEVMAELGKAYAAFCGEYGFSDVPTFGKWIQGFSGVPRG